MATTAAAATSARTPGFSVAMALWLAAAAAAPRGESEGGLAEATGPKALVSASSCPHPDDASSTTIAPSGCGRSALVGSSGGNGRTEESSADTSGVRGFGEVTDAEG